LQTPAVRELREKRNSAGTEEERAKAEKDYKIALRDAMIQSDEKIKGLLDKMDGVKTEANTKLAAKPVTNPEKSPAK